MRRRWVAGLAAAGLVLVGCGETPDEPPSEPEAGECVPADDAPTPAGQQWDQPPQMALDPEATYTATITTNCGTLVVELFAPDAPVAVNNFVFLANEGFYDGVTFHRVMEGFMIQGGDPTGTGGGGAGYAFDDELELATTHGYPRGTLAMANAGPDTNGSQFFIVHADATDTLPPNYVVFGELVDGADTLDTIATLPVEANPRGEMSVPESEVVITSVEVHEN